MDLSTAESTFRETILHGLPLPSETMPTLLAATRAYAAAGDPERVPPPDLAWVDDGTYRDVETNLELRLRRLGEQAATQTPYYERHFRERGIEPRGLDRESLARIPVLSRDAVSAAPQDFVCRDADVLYRTQTSATTGGAPLGLYFSAHEVTLNAYLTAIGSILSGAVKREDLFVFPASNRQVLSLSTNVLSLHMIGATVLWTWLKPPELTLELLAAEQRIPGKEAKASVAIFHASQLGMVVTEGLARGYGPADFGLRTLIVGGEVATAGLLRRARRLFGEEIQVNESYGTSEMWGGGGNVCPARNMHFEPTGLWEFLDPGDATPVSKGELATCVGTILPPFRDTMLLLRYDTGDLARVLDTCPCGEGGHVTGLIEGKRHASVRHDGGWTTPRDVMEALEDLDEVELPARFGFRAEDGGVAVEVVAPDAARGTIGDALEARGVPLRALLLRDAAEELERPFRLRVDVQ